MRSRSRVLLASAFAISSLVPPRAAFGFPLPPPSFSSVIPSAASVHGENGTFFRTDLWLSNQSSLGRDVTLKFYCYVGACSSPYPYRVVSVSLNSHETRLIGDVVGSFFSTYEAAGAIYVGWTQYDYDPIPRVAASSQTYSTDSVSGGTYGTGITSSGSWQNVQRAVFAGVAGDGGDRGAGFRTNVGFFNPYFIISGYIPVETSATLTLYGSDGAALGSPVTVSFRWGAQVNDIFKAAGAGTVAMRDATLLVDLSAPVYPYVTVIDNRSGASSYVGPVPDNAKRSAFIEGITYRQGAFVGGIPITVTQDGQTIVTRSDVSSGFFFIAPLARVNATITFSPGGGCSDVSLEVVVPDGGLNLNPQLCP